MTNSTAQTLFLALTRPNGDIVGFGTDRDLAVAAGVLVDLVAAGAAEVADEKTPRLHLTGVAQTADAALLAPFARFDGKPVAKALPSVKKAVAHEVGATLAARGDLRVEKHLGGLTTRYPLTRPEDAEDVRRSLTEVVAGGRPGSLAEVSALGIARSAKSVKHLVVEHAGMSDKELGRRVDELMAEHAKTGGVAQGVRSAVQSANAAVMAACAATIAVGASGS